jgi:Uma2 family endonuclease
MLTEISAPRATTLVEAESDEEKIASGLHGYICSKIGRLIGNHVDERNLGFLFDGQTTFNFNDKRPRRQTDVAFVSKTKLAYPKDLELDVIPDLVVEVVSRTDTIYDLKTKVVQYQAAGVPLVWVIYPLTQTAGIYRLETGLVEHGMAGDDELDGEKVLPGYKLPVKSIFANLPPEALAEEMAAANE